MNGTKVQQYRVIATTTTGFTDPKVDTTVMWEGTDTDELSVEYPPSDILFADPLGQKEIEDGWIITRCTFERMLEDGSWEKIDDPRRRLTPVTAYERAIDEENRHLFPGDYITSDCDRCGDYGCDECEDPYGVNCTSCDDHGCAKCDPNWCTTCDNNGCATCDPTSVCPACKNYCDPQYEPLGKDSGLCEKCEYYANLRDCDDCGMELTDSNKGNLCAACEYDRSRPTCSNNCHEFADGDDGLCSGCRFDFETKCSGCGFDLPNGEDGLCSNCRQNELDTEAYYRKYDAWWRRALRQLGFMK